MANKSLAIIAAISVIGLLFLVYLAATFESPQGSSSVAIEQPIPRPVVPIERVPVVETPEVETTEVIPSDDQADVEPLPELPGLNDSDPFVLPRLAALETGAALIRVLATEDLIRKFVVFTDNVAVGNLPQLEYPVQRVTQDISIRALDNNLFVMEPSSHQRFDQHINALVAVDVDQALLLYRLMSPLFQEAYAELGYRDQSFEPVLLAAIDKVLSARVPEGPFQLVKPSVMYLYAEQDIEDLSPVEKQLIRLGPENTRKLRAKLEEIRVRLQR